jgi:rhomboid protease GluP
MNVSDPGNQDPTRFSDVARGDRPGGAAYPEIFPPGSEIPPPQYAQPGYGYRPPPPQRSGQRRSWASAPATYVLVGINCAVFLFMVLSGVSLMSPTTDQLVHWGADYGIFVLQGQWWRLLTATFVHVGIIHLATNMWCLWNLGLLGEPLLGPVGVLAVYLLTGIAGNLLSTAVHPQIVGAGASGAVFGIAGALILLLKSPLLPVPQAELKRLRQSVIYFAILNFVIGASTFILPSPIKIDNMAHLGGFLCGLLVGVPLLPRIGAPRLRFLRRQWITFLGATLLLLLFAYGIASYWRSAP